MTSPPTSDSVTSKCDLSRCCDLGLGGAHGDDDDDVIGSVQEEVMINQ